MATTRGRLVQINQVIFDQADFFEADGFTREVGLLTGNIALEIFHKNIAQPWPLLDGTTVTNAQVVSGNVFFHEIPANPGFYNVRFRPNALGFWRVTLTFAAGEQVLAQDFDVTEDTPTVSSGLKASFVKP